MCVVFETLRCCHVCIWDDHVMFWDSTGVRTSSSQLYAAVFVRPCLLWLPPSYHVVLFRRSIIRLSQVWLFDCRALNAHVYSVPTFLAAQNRASDSWVIAICGKVLLVASSRYFLKACHSRPRNISKLFGLKGQSAVLAVNAVTRLQFSSSTGQSATDLVPFHHRFAFNVGMLHPQLNHYPKFNYPIFRGP